MAVFTPYSGTGDTSLTNALLAPSSGINVVSGSISLHSSGPDAVEFYDGSLAPLGIGSGLLLTSGITPGTSNTVGWYGQDNGGFTGFYNGDADIDSVVNTVFQTQSYDATTLSFDFTVSDPNATSVSFDLVFGSDEFPEWVDQFVDSAIVMVNGVNYALFNHDPSHPLSVISPNVAAGYFQDNASGFLPIEYDGVSHVLKIVAPINAGGVNHIKIGIADTGDHVLDSGIFLSNFTAGNIPGSGVVITPPTDGTEGNDDITCTSKDEYIDLKGGDDKCFAGAGDDIVVAGSGNDTVYGGSGNDQVQGGAGNDIIDGGVDIDTAVFAGASGDYTIADLGNGFAVMGAEGDDALVNVEQVKFSNGLFSIGAGGVLTPVVDPATPPANTAGSVFISGIGAEGKTLTANITDPDGISGAVSYQWQVSGDNGASWSDVGIDSSTYVVSASDVGSMIQVVAAYTDNGAVAESPVSAAKLIQEVGGGDLLVTLLQLQAPLGAVNINPLTTLVKAAIDFGTSPNDASAAVHSVFGLPAGVNLQNYDSYSALLSNPLDATALAVEKIGVEIAVLTSLSDDDKGTNLAFKVLEAAAGGNTLNLADAHDLANILGIDITGITDKNLYPEPLREIFDRNDNIDQAANLADIEAEWQDLLSIQDNINSTSIADLSIHVNQAPVGSASASLAEGLENNDYIVNASDLLQGFSDPEGDGLSVVGLSSDSGTVTDNGDGTFTISPPSGFNGPVELSYIVSDGLGGNIAASQLFVVAPAAVNSAPTGSATAVLAAGSEDTNYTVSASDLLQGFSDVDGDALSVTGLTADHGTVTDNGDGTFTITPDANYNGAVNLSYNVTDGTDSVAASQSFSLSAVNDAPTGSATAVLAAGSEDSNYTVSASDLLQGFSDVDGDALSVTGLTADHGSVTDNGDGTFTIAPDANYNGAVNLSYNVTDGTDSVAANQSFTLSAVNDAPTGSATAVLTAGSEDTNYTVSASDLLQGFSDVDGDALSVTGLTADHGTVTDNGDGTFTITPDANYNGAVNLSYSVTDGTDSVAANQSFTIGAVNDAPTANADSDSAGENETKSFDVLANDTDPDAGDSKILASINGATVTSSNASVNGIDVSAALSIVSGQIQLAPGALFDALSSSETATVVVNYTMKDSADAASSSSLTITVSGADEAPVFNIINGTAGNDARLNGSAGNDLINGLGGNDNIYAKDGDDLIIGGSGNDQVTAGAGNDTVIASLNDGNDTYSGGTGIDTFDASFASASLTINLSASTATGSEIGSDKLQAFEAVIGGAGNDAITGNSSGNTLSGNAGDDVIAGLKGNDTILGGAGNDIITGNAGRDVMTGGTEADTFVFKLIGDFATGALFDEIVDFSHAQGDKIDISAIDAIKGGINNAFTFIGNAAFSGAGQLHYTANGAGGVTVSGDINGDKVADFNLTVDSVASLEVSDFIL